MAFAATQSSEGPAFPWRDLEELQHLSSKWWAVAILGRSGVGRTRMSFRGMQEHVRVTLGSLVDLMEGRH